MVVLRSSAVEYNAEGFGLKRPDVASTHRSSFISENRRLTRVHVTFATIHGSQQLNYNMPTNPFGQFKRIYRQDCVYVLPSNRLSTRPTRPISVE